LAIAAYYFTYLGAIGVFMPFISLYLKDLGLPAAEVTQLMAVGPLAALMVPPLVGLLADLGRARVWLLRLGTAATAVASLGFVGAHGRPVLVATMVALAAFRAPLLSLVDVLALDRGNYGRIRLWGSAGFLVAVLAGGWLHDRVGVLRVMLGCSAGLVLAGVVAFGLPAPPLETRPRIFAEWRKMLSQRCLWLFLVAVWLTQSACAIYDSGFSLHLRSLGFDGRFVSQAWAVGVGAEVILMWGAHVLLQRARAQRLLAVGAGVSGVRWFLLARAHTGAVILLLQPLHAISFGLT